MDASEVLTAYIAAWQSGEPERAWAFYADDVVMHLPGRGSLAGDHHGRAAVIATIEALLTRTSDLNAEIEVLDHLVSANRVAMVLREGVVRGEKHLEIRRVNIYRVEHDKIVEIDIYEANQYEVDDFFG